METKETKDRLIETARRLFHEHGFHATGIALILQEANVNSGTLYHYFQNKEALLLAVLDRYVEMLMPAVMQPAFATTTNPIERIFAVLAGYRSGLLVTQFKLGCPIGNLALEVADSIPRAREKIDLNFDNWTAAVEHCLVEAAERFPPSIDFRALARFVLTVMEGGMMLARARRRIEPYDAAVRELRNYIDLMLNKKPVESAPPPVSSPRPHRPQPSFRVW